MAGKRKGIYKRGDIYWISYVGHDGRVRRESAKTTKLKEAEAILTSRRNAVLEGKESAVKRVKNTTFKELAERYKEFIKPQKSYKAKCFNLGQLEREFGNLRLSDFTIELLERFQSKIITDGLKSESTRINNGIRPLKPATANRLLATLKHAFTKAYNWKYCSEDTLKDIREVKLFKEDNQRTQFLSNEQCGKLLLSCDMKNSSKYLKKIIIFALHTGCRKSEILNLKWGDVDLTHNRITITDTKNGESRKLPINSILMETLKNQVKFLHSPYVFCDEHGNRYDGGRILKLFKTVCKRADINDFRFHDLRHTYASHLVMAGVDLPTVSKLLGHKTISMTMRYAHFASEHFDNAADMLATRLNCCTSQLLHNQAA